MKYSIDEIFAAAQQEFAAWKGEGEIQACFKDVLLDFLSAVAKRLQEPQPRHPAIQ